MRTHLLATFALSLVTAACTTDADVSPADRLTIHEDGADAVSGSFSSADGDIDFSFERATSGLRAVIKTDARELLEVRIDFNGRHDIEVFDKHRVTGGRDLTLEPALVEQLSTQLRDLPELGEALEAIGIDPELLTTLTVIGCRDVGPRWTWSSDEIVQNTEIAQ